MKLGGNFLLVGLNIPIAAVHKYAELINMHELSLMPVTMVRGGFSI